MRDTSGIDELFKDELADHGVDQRGSDWTNMKGSLHDARLLKDRSLRRYLPALLLLVGAAGWGMYFFEIGSSSILGVDQEIAQQVNIPANDVVGMSNEDNSIVPDETNTQPEPSRNETINSSSHKPVASNHSTDRNRGVSDQAAFATVDNKALLSQNNSTKDIILVEEGIVVPSILNEIKSIEGITVSRDVNQSLRNILTMEPKGLIEDDKDAGFVIPVKKASRFYASSYFSFDENQYKMVTNGELGEIVKDKTFNPDPIAYFKREPLIVEDAFQFSTGGFLGYRLNDRLSVEGGMMYSRKKYLNHNTTFQLVDQEGVNPSRNTGVSYHNYFTNLGSRFVDVPLRLKYTVKSRMRTSFYSAAGLVIHSRYFFTHNGKYTQSIYEGEFNTVSYEQRKIATSLHLAAGLSVRVNRRFGFFIEPSIKQGVSPFIKEDVPLDFFMNSVSLGTGITVEL